jgi:hypothetical protein
MFRKVAIGLLALTLIAPTLACGAGKGKRRGSSRGGSDSGNTSTQGGAGSAKAIDVNRTVWYAGMKLTFGKLAYKPDNPAGSRLTMDTTVENIADTGVTGSPAFTIKIGDKFVNGGFNRDLTEVPAHETSRTTVDFTTTGDPGGLGKGVLTVGDGQSAQAVVPLGGGDTKTLEPVNLLAAPATVTATDMTYTFKSCRLRADKPEDHREVGKDQRIILCYFDARSNARALINLDHRYFRLRLPDNSVVAPEVGPNKLLQPQEQALDQGVRFLITWPTPGQYRLQSFASTAAPAGAADLPLTVDAS